MGFSFRIYYVCNLLLIAICNIWLLVIVSLFCFLWFSQQSVDLLNTTKDDIVTPLVSCLPFLTWEIKTRNDLGEAKNWTATIEIYTSWSSSFQMFYKIGTLKNFAIFTEKHLQSVFNNSVADLITSFLSKV